MLYGQNLRNQVRFSPNRGRASKAAAEDLSDQARERCGSLLETSCMSRRILPASAAIRQVAVLAVGSILATAAFAAEPNFPITPQQRATAQRTADAGVPLSEVLPTAPDIYTVKTRDTLWDISKMYLTSPWRWPELWGMNLEQVRNPHLIFPGQTLFLDKSNGRARLRMGAPVGGAGDAGLSPRVRSKDIALDGIASIPFNLIEPFLNEAVIFETNELASAPRIVATQEDRVLLSRGDTAYVRGEIGPEREYRIFREPRPLRDPTTKEILGYEATYVGASEYTVQGETRTNAEGKAEIIPATFTVTSIRKEAGVGDRLAPVQAREYTNYAPHPPAAPISGQIVSIYGDALTAGQNQIVALNRGAVDGIERGHVLALFRDGKLVVDPTEPGRTKTRIKLPDERHGVLFVFRVFSRMSYALILSVKEPVTPGDRFTQP
jgi:LysM repeat protein